MKFLIQGNSKIHLQTLGADSALQNRGKCLHTRKSTSMFAKVEQFHVLHVCMNSILGYCTCGTTYNNLFIRQTFQTKECSINQSFQMIPKIKIQKTDLGIMCRPSNFVQQRTCVYGFLLLALVSGIRPQSFYHKSIFNTLYISPLDSRMNNALW